MFAEQERVEVEVRSVRLCTGDEHAVVVVAPRDPAEGSALWIGVGDGEARVLSHELGGRQTSRIQALALSSRIAEVLQGHIVGSLLVSCSVGFVRGALQLETPGGVIEVPTEPGHAIAAAAWLGIPLLADRRLFIRPEGAPPSISGPLAEFLRTLDLESLDEPAH